MRLLTIFALMFLFSSGASANDDVDKARCAAVKKQIRHVQSRMRAGYTRAQGERLEARLRKLKKQRKSVCR